MSITGSCVPFAWRRETSLFPLTPPAHYQNNELMNCILKPLGGDKPYLHNTLPLGEFINKVPARGKYARAGVCENVCRVQCFHDQPKCRISPRERQSISRYSAISCLRLQNRYTKSELILYDKRSEAWGWSKKPDERRIKCDL